MHGPGTTFTTIRWPDATVPIYDDARHTIQTPARRRLWDAALEGALSLWAPTGLTFPMERGQGGWVFDLMASWYPGKLRVARNGTGDHSTFEGTYPDLMAATIVVNLINDDELFWRKPWGLKGLLCHEIGHALGLDHRYDAHTSSVMAGGKVPDEHDITSVMTYYFQQV